MLNTLHIHVQGVNALLWNLYDDLYTRIKSFVKLKVELSAPFEEMQLLENLTGWVILG